jgi:hypothetical protein
VSGCWAAAGGMGAYRRLLVKNASFINSGAVVERPHLLKDFTTRKRAMRHFELDSHKKELSREVYLKDREINTIKVHTINIKF